MDFINARRFQEEYREYMNDPDNISENSDFDDDLPFLLDL